MNVLLLANMVSGKMFQDIMSKLISGFKAICVPLWDFHIYLYIQKLYSQSL